MPNSYSLKFESLFYIDEYRTHSLIEYFPKNNKIHILDDKGRSFNNCFNDKCQTSTLQSFGATHLIVTGVMAPRLLRSSIVRRYSITIRLLGYPLAGQLGYWCNFPPRGFLSKATACYTEQVRPLYRVRRENHPLYRTGYEITVIPNRFLTQAPSALRSKLVLTPRVALAIHHMFYKACKLHNETKNNYIMVKSVSACLTYP